MQATGFIPAQASHSASSFVVTTLTNGTNATSSFFTHSSAREIALLPFRLIAKIDTVLFDNLPRFVGRTTGLDAVASRAAAAVAGYWAGNHGVVNTAAGTVGDAAAQIAGQAAGADDVARGWMAVITEAFQTSTFKSYWGMLHYVFSRWAFSCFIMALVLNRVAVYAAPRQRIHLTWTRRLALRLIPILLFATQIKQLLQALRCQTSPDFALYRHGDMNKYSLLDWNTESGLVHKLTGGLLWQSDDEAACRAVGMMKTDLGLKHRLGSFSLLWPTFLRLCLSYFVESLSCTLQGIATQTEGMSVFEHSLAFAEAETMITHALGSLAAAAGSKNSTASSSVPTNTTMMTQGTIPASGTILAITDAIATITGPHILDRVNIPIEVLLVALLSCCNALSSHIISVMGQQQRLRLINTGFWGLSFIGVFIWGFFATSGMVRNDGSSDPKPISGLLHFPTVAIIGFLPHIAILLGVLVCACIYLLALTLTAISLGTNPHIRQPSSLGERISIAHDNLQATIQAKGITLKWSEDFYTALLRLGFAALTAASEAVFLNEGRSVEMKQFTWLEEDRLDELQFAQQAFDAPENGNFQIAEEYGIPPSHPELNNKNGAWKSGYSKERKFDKKEGQVQADGTFVYPNPRTDGVGALQRTARFYLLFIFIRGIFFTITGWIAFALGALLDRMGITARPNWLRRIVGKSVKKMISEQKQMRDNGSSTILDFWMLDDDGNLVLPRDDDLDIEPEMRKRLDNEGDEDVNASLDEKMYDWWKAGGWFGSTDRSGEYQPSQIDNEDTTSVVSMSTSANSTNNEEAYEDVWESESDGRRTPTQKSLGQPWSFSHVSRSRSNTPDVSTDTPLDTATLARLLNPTDPASREEARILASHLSSGSHAQNRIMTRSQYRKIINREQTRVLLAGRRAVTKPLLSLSSQEATSSSSSKETGPLTPAEEAQILESLLLARRTQRSAAQSSTYPRTPGTEEDEANCQTGPPCVVCQSQARTIIAWPCRCLSLCEDCRVSLAMNNFGNCVTCRRNVSGFVRLYIP